MVVEIAFGLQARRLVVNVNQTFMVYLTLFFIDFSNFYDCRYSLHKFVLFCLS